jgi:hypothetical protein
MRSDALFHNVAWVAGEQLLAELDCLVDDDDYARVFGVVYIRIKAALKAYEQQAERMFHRLHPTRN